jgi:sugar O-acyltransferase (sialic acid O-acetyltransferase NeuD family)
MIGSVAEAGQRLPDVIVVGAGGHALVAIDVLRAAGRHVAGCVTSDGSAAADIGRLGVRLLGTEAVLDGPLDAGTAHVFVAIGDNPTRRDVTGRLLSRGVQLVRAMSPRAVVSDHARVEDGVLVMPGAVVNALATIGVGAIVNTGASVDHECTVGDFAHVGPGAAVAGSAVIGEGALIGMGSAIAPGREIGAWSTVGAGATVVTDVPDGVVVVGTPAREQPSR